MEHRQCYWIIQRPKISEKTTKIRPKIYEKVTKRRPYITKKVTTITK